MARLTQIDYDREMTFVAIGGEGDTLGVVRSVTDPDNDDAQFSIVIRSDGQGRGLGIALMKKIIAYTRQRGMNGSLARSLTTISVRAIWPVTWILSRTRNPIPMRCSWRST